MGFFSPWRYRTQHKKVPFQYSCSMNCELDWSRFKLVPGFSLQNKTRIAVDPPSYWDNRKITWFIMSPFCLVYVWTCGKNFRREAFLLSFLKLTPLCFVIFIFGNLFCKQCPAETYSSESNANRTSKRITFKNTCWCIVKIATLRTTACNII